MYARENAHTAGAEETAPGVENHHGIGAMTNLFAQVHGNRVGVDREHPMQKVGPRVQQAGVA